MTNNEKEYLKSKIILDLEYLGNNLRNSDSVGEINEIIESMKKLNVQWYD